MNLDLAEVDRLLADGLRLTAGHHDDGRQACVMDLIGFLTTGEWTDIPACVHRTLASRVHQINDGRGTTHEDRARLVRQAGPLLVGTDTWDDARACSVVARAGYTIDGLTEALRQAAAMTDDDLASITLAGADLRSANLTGAYLAGADMSGAYLGYANLRRADLTGATLTGADLREAKLGNAELSSADLTSAQFRGADLYGADLRGADLRGADLRGANLYGARHDATTRWPDGFDPPKQS
jgi:hypothetical protein